MKLQYGNDWKSILAIGKRRRILNERRNRKDIRDKWRNIEKNKSELIYSIKKEHERNASISKEEETETSVLKKSRRKKKMKKCPSPGVTEQDRRRKQEVNRSYCEDEDLDDDIEESQNNNTEKTTEETVESDNDDGWFACQRDIFGEDELF